MAVPTYDDLLAHYGMDSSIMRETFDDKKLRQFSLTLDVWETLAKFLEMSNSDIVNIKSQGDVVEQKLRMLECWKQRCGSMATYEAMVEALLQIGRTDLAEKVITLRCSSKDTPTLETATTNSSISCPKESSLTVPTSSASSSGIKDTSSSAGTPPLSLPATPSEQSAQVISTLKELEEEFYDLVIFIEDTLKNNEISLHTIIRRFRMLPQSIRRQHETDRSYKEIRKSILNSKTIKELFDNLTELRHWNYMTPDTLTHIIQDVKIDEIHQKIEKYKGKLSTFKTNTKLRELIGISFPVPDYCMELTMEVEGWENKTIQEVENRAVNIMRRAAYSGGPHVGLGWKGVCPGSIKITFIFMESVKLNPEKIPQYSDIASVQVDGSTTLHFRDYTKVPTSLWESTNKMRYNAVGGRDVLIIAPDLPLPHPEAVARRPGQLTEEDKLKLQRQGLPPDCRDELDIIKMRCKLDRRLQIVGIHSAEVSQNDVTEDVLYLLRTTQNNGVIIYYIGAGRRGTGDWCFEDGFISFRDIAQLYLRASHNFKGRVLTIVSDCSYSGCWVRDCMEFLDEQGVQPCGHKAREKGMVIKVVASCKSYEIPTEYCYSVYGIRNEESTGVVRCKVSKLLLKTQTTDCIDSSHLHCTSKTINEPCTLQLGLTWRKLNKKESTSSAFVKQSLYRQILQTVT